LSTIVTWVQRSADGVAEPSELTLAIGGLANGAHMDWASQSRLAIGDEVLVKIVETANPDPPVRTRPTDPAADAADERRCYEHLRLKYEGK
jgi:hypothetical protein